MSTLTSVDNATAVAKMYDAFGKGDINYIMDHVADNCKWIVRQRRLSSWYLQL